MSKKEEKIRQYSNKKVEEKGLYPLCSIYTQRKLTTFDAYELEEAFEDGLDAGKQEDEHLVWQISEANYEKGKKETIDKVCEFIQTNVREYHKSGVFHVAEFVKDLRKAMEE